MSTEHEEKYFAQQEADRRAAKRLELQRMADEAASRRAMAATLATDDDSLLTQLRELGFDADTARGLDVLPLVHVAWADGSVAARERARVLAILETRGIDRTSEAFLLVEALLEQRPSESFLAETLDLLRALGGPDTKSVVGLCREIAAASGGFFGVGDKVGPEERALIAQIASELGESAIRAFQAKL